MEKKARISTKSFIHGRQSELGHIISGLANLDAVTSFAVTFDEDDEATQPLLTRQIRRLADQYSSAKFTNFVEKYRTEAHVPHALLVQAQTVFASMASVAMSTLWHNAVMSGKPVPVSSYEESISQFKETFKNAKTTPNGATLGVYSQVPRSYSPPAVIVSKRKCDDIPEENRRIRPLDDKRPRQEEAKKKCWFNLKSGNKIT